jgi:cyclophilin family peptidyl-prolyl cis-trans isomerase
MKKIIYSLLICLAFSLSSCKDETTQDPSKVTYFADLELSGPGTLLWPLGETFVEPGYYAELKGEDVTADVVIKGEVKTDKAGVYTRTYAIANEDGFEKTQSRTIFVYDATPSSLESGFYLASKDSYREADAGVTAFGKDYRIVLFQVEPGVFFCSDLLGGWYEQRAAYGAGFGMEGHIQLAGDHTFTLLDSHLAYWGDGIDELTNGVYNPETKTLTYAASYAGSMVFNLIITKE